MAKKKSPNGENASAEAPHDVSEQLASLKSLNNLLVRETVERRQQIDTLRRSNESLECKISLSIANFKRLEQEKSRCEDRMLASEIERDVGVLVISSQLCKNEMNVELTQKLKYLEEEREGLTAQIVELEEIKLRRTREELDHLLSEMALIRWDLDAKREEADGLRLMLEELQVKNEEGREEMGLLRVEFDRIRKEKDDIEESFESVTRDRDSIQHALLELTEQHEDLRREMRDAIDKRYEIEAARNEMGVEISRLQKEVDVLTAGLRSNKDALDMALQERDAIQNDLNLRKEEAERAIESLMTERASMEKRLMESSQSIDDLKIKMEELAKDRDEIEEARAEKEAAISKLLNEVADLHSTISSFQEYCDDLTKINSQLLRDLDHQKELLGGVRGERDVSHKQIARLEEEQTGLQLKVCQLEKTNGEVREELKRAMSELDQLMEERKEGNVKLELVINEKTELLERLNGMMGRMRELVEEKDAIERKRIEQEHQIKRLLEEVGQLSKTVSTLHELCKEGEEKNNLLQADINRVLSEKDILSAKVVEQRREAEGLRSKIKEMEKIHEEDEQGREQLKTEKSTLVEEMKEKERCFELLMEAKTSTESSLMECTQKLKDLQIKIEFAAMVSQRALSMLKQAAETVSASGNEENGLKGEDEVNSEEMGDEIRPFVTELEAIKRAYRRRLQEVEDMNQELRSLQTSVAESKKMNLLTWASSAATVLAAVSFACVARRR